MRLLPVLALGALALPLAAHANDPHSYAQLDAEQVYAKAKDGYHPITQNALKRLFAKANGKQAAAM